MNDQILSLARRELAKYGFAAEFALDPALPSFEIRNLDGRITICGPSAVEVLYGVYELAERFGGYFFYEPSRDRFDASSACPLPEGVAVQVVKPLLKRRGFIQEFPFDADTPALFDWMAKNKLNYLLVWMKYYDHLSDELKQMAAERGTGRQEQTLR